jgi:hypothetical protein
MADPPVSEPSGRPGSAGQAAAGMAGAEPDYAGLADDPPTGGLPAVLGRLRDAAAAHDDELADSGRLAPPG